jgi:hypothetical protein
VTSSKIAVPLCKGLDLWREAPASHNDGLPIPADARVLPTTLKTSAECAPDKKRSLYLVPRSQWRAG